MTKSSQRDRAFIRMTRPSHQNHNTATSSYHSAASFGGALGDTNSSRKLDIALLSIPFVVTNAVHKFLEYDSCHFLEIGMNRHEIIKAKKLFSCIKHSLLLFDRVQIKLSSDAHVRIDRYKADKKVVADIGLR